MKKFILFTFIFLSAAQNIIQADTGNQNLIHEFNVYYKTRQKIILAHPGIPEDKILYLTGSELLKNRHYANALKRFMEIVYRYPDSPFTGQSFLSVVRCYYALKQYVFVEKEIALYLKNNPQPEQKDLLLYYRALAAKKEGRNEDAITHFKNSMDNSNNKVFKQRVSQKVAEMYFSNGNRMEALQYLKIALQLTEPSDELRISRLKRLEQQIRWHYLMNGFYKDRSIASIHNAGDSVFILTYINGIAVFNRRKESITGRFEKAQGLRSNLVRYMAKVKNDYWISTYSGLSIYKPAENRWINAEGNAPKNTLKSIEVTPEEVWVATLGEGLFRYDLSTEQWENFTVNQGAPGIAVVGLKMDENKLWVATLDGGIGYYNKTTKKWKKFHAAMGERARNIKCIEANRDYVFCGTFKHGLFVYDKRKKTWKNFTVENSKLTSNNLMSMKLIGNRLYIGTYNGGVTTIDLADEWKWGKIDTRDGLPSNDVTCIEQEGRFIWFGTINAGAAVYLEDR